MHESLTEKTSRVWSSGFRDTVALTTSPMIPVRVRIMMVLMVMVTTSFSAVVVNIIVDDGGGKADDNNNDDDV